MISMCIRLVCGLMMASLLLAVGSGCISCCHTDGYHDIHAAALAGNLAQVTADLDRNPKDVNLPDSAGLTPLHLAASHCHTEVVTLLLNRGADIDCQATGGATPLHLAAQEGCTSAVNLLLEKHAKVNARDDQNRTPLTRAIQWHQDATAAILRQHGGTE